AISSWVSGGLRAWLLAVQRKVDGEHVDTWLSKDTEGAALSVAIDQLPHGLRVEFALARNARHLIQRRGRADVRIEPAARGGDQIDGNGSRVARIGGAEGVHTSLHRLDQIWIRRTQVGS